MTKGTHADKRFAPTPTPCLCEYKRYVSLYRFPPTSRGPDELRNSNPPPSHLAFLRQAYPSTSALGFAVRLQSKTRPAAQVLGRRDTRPEPALVETWPPGFSPLLSRHVQELRGPAGRFVLEFAKVILHRNHMITRFFLLHCGADLYRFMGTTGLAVGDARWWIQLCSDLIRGRVL